MPEWSVPGYAGLRVLGSGGFGEVLLARHNASGTLVAIKYLRSDLLADPGFAGMFRGEAQVLASLEDLNVVRLYEYVESPSGAAIVMELVNGVSLREILAHQGRTAPEAALVVLQGSLMGLAAAHRRGVVHRDYKPENVLVNGQGLSKLADFGLAARTGDRPVPAGTLMYAAPEQLDGAPASPAGDIYSATATFYECLTGRPPFTGHSAELLRQHRSEPVPLDPVPEPLRPLVSTGMAKDPQRRPAEARAFATQLQAAAFAAYGSDWERRGRSHLGEAALLLAGLWPLGTPSAAQGTATQRITGLRHLTPAKAAIAAGAVIAVAAAGTALALSRTHRPSNPSHPVARVQPIPLQPATTKPTTSTPTPNATTSMTTTPTPTPTTITPTGTVVSPRGYDKYTNSRYGFTVLWPSSFSPQSPPNNRDGETWTSRDGRVLLSASGINNTPNYSPAQDEEIDARSMSVVYENISGNIVTVSGYKNNGRTIVYQRDVVGPGAIDTLYWSYPASQKALWDAAVTLTARTFQPGDVTTAH